jgi:hypothetical protein
MEKTKVVQNCTEILTAPDTIEYKIETTVTDPGELPFAQIFVYTIVDVADPAQDVFARVATPGDLDGGNALLTSRDDAVSGGLSEFLSLYFSVQYPDLTTASQARLMISTRINELINNWILYRDSFMANSGEIQYFPTTDPEVEQHLTEIYVTTRDARVVAEEDLATATTDLTLAEKDSATAQATYEIYKKEQVFCQKTHLVDWVALDGALTPYISAVSTFLTNSKTDFVTLANIALAAVSPPVLYLPVVWHPIPYHEAALASLSLAWTNWISAIDNMTTVREAYNTTGASARTAVGADLLAFCQTAAMQVAASYNAKVAADSLVADAVLTKKEAEAALAFAQQAEDAALAAVIAVCPTFDPASV